MKLGRVEKWRSEGQFWIGEDEENSVPGTLVVYENHRSEIQLGGLLDERIDHLFTSETERVPVLNGTTHKYRHISMLQALETARTINSSGLHRCTYTARRMVASQHSRHDWGDGKALDFSAEVRGLADWLDVSGFQIEQNFADNSVLVKHKRPKLPVYAIDDVYSLQFGFSRTGPSHTTPQTEVIIRQSSELVIKAATPQPIEDFMHHAQSIADLICLGIGEAMAFSPSSARFAVPTAEANGMWADLYFVTSPVTDVEVPHPGNMLFSFREVQARLAEMIRVWASNVSDVSTTYQLYFATIRSSSMYAEHRLFNFHQALETFHRRRYANALVCHNPASPRGPSSGERIKDIVHRLGCQWILPDPWESNLQRITKVRNYLVHGEREPPAEDLTALALLNAGSRLQMICEVVLLSQAGFNKQEVNHLLQSKIRTRRLIYS